jgi:hypothetical protein
MTKNSLPSSSDLTGPNYGQTGFSSGKHRTAQTELMACVFLLGEGYEVFRNISCHGAADLIACKGDVVLRIDVKSGRAPKLTPEQEKDGVIILHVDDNGRCEFAIDRKQRIEKELRSILSRIAGMSAKEGAEHLNQRGITTPNGGQWSLPLVMTMRERVALT